MAIFKTCLVCNKEFRTFPSVRRVTCSHECAEIRKSRRPPKRIKIRQPKPCIICGEPLPPMHKKFCSFDCKQISRLRNKPKKKVISTNPIIKLKEKCCKCHRAYATGFYKAKPFCKTCWRDRKK